MGDAPPPADPPQLPEPPPPEPTPVAHPRPSAARLFAVVLALFVLPGALAQSFQPALGLAWSEAAALLLPAAVAAAGWNLRPRAALLLERRPTAAQLGAAAAVGLGGFAVAVVLANLWLAALPEELVRRFDLSQLFDQPPLARYALAVLAATVAPFCEEAAFRGFILTALRRRAPARAAIAGSALLFAVMHLDPVRFPALVVLGATFGWLAWRSGSLWPAVIAHGLNNGIVAALSLAGEVGSGAGEPRADPREALALLVPAGALLAVAAALYRRATPAPPDAADALAPRDPRDLDPRYSARRVGTGLRLAVAGALAAFAALAALGIARR